MRIGIISMQILRHVARCCMVLGWLRNITICPAHFPGPVRRQCGTICDGYQLLRSTISLHQDGSCQQKSVSTAAKESIGLHRHCWRQSQSTINDAWVQRALSFALIIIDHLRMREYTHTAWWNHASSSHFQMLKWFSGASIFGPFIAHTCACYANSVIKLDQSRIIVVTTWM